MTSLLSPAGTRPQKHAHRLVAEVAKAAAHELYDALMHDNVLAKAWRDQHPGLNAKGLEARFVAKNWARCLEIARATLALQLRGSSDESLKSTIHDALVLDASLIRGRVPAQPLPAGERTR